MFERWCLLNGEKPYGASPETVVRFINEISSLGISHVWQAVLEISRMHYGSSLNDPTLSGLVTNAINKISGIQPPRSWPPAEKHRFLSLPFDIQLIISKREADRDREVRQLQNEFAQLKRKESENASTKSTTVAA